MLTWRLFARCKALETAVFPNVSFKELPTTTPKPNPRTSVAEFRSTISKAKLCALCYSADKLWEAPNWSPDGKYLIANSSGVIYRFRCNPTANRSPKSSLWTRIQLQQ